MLDTILYVEDDIDTREEISFFLRNKAREIILANDGAEGLKLYEEHSPSVVISDINMPNMNGLDMAASIMAIDPQAHIVLLTAHNDANNLHKAITVGIKEYLVKPVQFQDLAKKIDFFDVLIEEKRRKKETYQLLKEYKYAVDNSAMFIKIDLFGQIIYANKAFCEALNFEKKSVESMALSEFGLSDIDFSHMIHSVKGSDIWSGKFELTNKEGLDVLVEGNFFAMRSLSGSVSSVMGILHDITEIEYLRKIFETKLDQTKDTLHEKQHYIAEHDRVLEHGIAMCRIDKDGQFLKISNAFSDLFEANELLSTKKSIQNLLKWSQNSFEEMIDAVRQKRIYKDSLQISLNKKIKFLNITCIGISSIFNELDEIVIIFEDASDLLEQHGKLYEMQIEFLYMLSEIIEKHSEEAGFHTKRVSEYSALLAKELGMEKDEVEQIRLASIMHDIGKIGIPYNILVKNNALTLRERFIMQDHSKIGYDILNHTKQPLLKTAAIIAHEHHERWDGNGYPRRLKGEDIHIYGRIVAIADVFDALSKQRVYKKAWAINDVYKYLEINSGIQFDPKLVDIFISLKPTIEDIRKNY